MPYNQVTTIDDKEIWLTAEEKKQVDNFHKSRIAFAFLSDGRCALNIHDVREHKIYLQEDFGVSFAEFENLIRGFIIRGRIVFYKSSAFLPIENISPQHFAVVYEKAVEFFGKGEYEVWNGLKVGKLGEQWQPIQKMKNVFL